MLSQTSDQLDKLKFLTPLTLFQAKELAAGSNEALLLAGILAVLGLMFYIAAIGIFRRRDLSL